MNIELAEALIVRANHEVCAKYGIICMDRFEDGPEKSCIHVDFDVTTEPKRIFRSAVKHAIAALVLWLAAIVCSMRWADDTGLQFIFGLAFLFELFVVVRLFKALDRMHQRPGQNHIHAEILRRTMELFAANNIDLVPVADKNGMLHFIPRNQ